MSGLEDLYREIILDHYRTPRNRGELESPPAVESRGHNPLCGDELDLGIELQAGLIGHIAFQGRGCSISLASASMTSSSSTISAIGR